MKRFALRQGLPVIHDANTVHVGLAPPNAILVEDVPEFLPPLLRFASQPRTVSELEDRAFAEGLSRSDAATLVSELLDANILTDERVDSDSRHSRHDLYYALAHPDSAHRSSSLGDARVGLVGVGGIGTNIAMQLSAAGVGYLHLVDADVVETSNLTRQFLFDESDVGRVKVDAAKQRLTAKNSDLTVTATSRQVSSIDDLMPVFRDVSMVVVSADTPQKIADWANKASLATGTPFSCAGYQDTRGLVGPLITPGRGPCLACAASTDGLAADESATSGSIEDVVNLNDSYQAPSFGPLNAMVAACQTTEVLRLLMGASPRTAGRRLVIDSITFVTTFEDYDVAPGCPACGSAA